jgi:ACR3 family arsenite efflux pump ArsB|tara:strand:- start:1709 stop:1888 length:180 start_codon:yes stop_codon:yes gene_type:complete
MLNNITKFLGSILASAFLIGLATTLTRSSMIGFWDVLPVFILMAIAIFMMIYEAFFDKK